MIRDIALASLVLTAALPSHALTCDELQAQIAAKIQAAGVTRFTLTVVDAQADACGKVVGSCNNGASKIVYLQTTSPADAAGSPSRQRAGTGGTAPDGVLTECKPGYGGPDCSMRVPAR